MPMRERFRRRDTWLRYGIAVALAYLLLTTPAAIISLGPAILILTFVGQDSIHYLLAAVLMTPWCIFLAVRASHRREYCDSKEGVARGVPRRSDSGLVDLIFLVGLGRVGVLVSSAPPESLQSIDNINFKERRCTQTLVLPRES